MCYSEMKVEQMVARRTHGNEANHRHVIKSWLLLERLNLQTPAFQRSSVDVTLVCPSLRDLAVNGLNELEMCKVASPVLSKLRVDSCPRLDVSSMILPSLEYVDVLDCNVSALLFDFDVCRSGVFL